LRGVWIVELSELDVLNRAELARAKAFLSQQTERFRLPYGRRIIHVPRQCVFVGTTNADSWLKDETGGRRFWPVRCRQIDLDGLRRDRDQLWAEALHLCRAGATWWLDEEDVIQDAIEEQKGRYQADVWQELRPAAADRGVASHRTASRPGGDSVELPPERVAEERRQRAANRRESMKAYESHIAGPPGDTSNGQLCLRCGTELSYFGPKLDKTKPPLWPVGAEVRNGAPCCGYWKSDSGLPSPFRKLMESSSVQLVHLPRDSEYIEIEIPKGWLSEEEPPF
jgi:Virulence-associated protein E